jgi:hypothetical protein
LSLPVFTLPLKQISRMVLSDRQCFCSINTSVSLTLPFVQGLFLSAASQFPHYPSESPHHHIMTPFIDSFSFLGATSLHSLLVKFHLQIHLCLLRGCFRKKHQNHAHLLHWQFTLKISNEPLAFLKYSFKFIFVYTRG